MSKYPIIFRLVLFMIVCLECALGLFLVFFIVGNLAKTRSVLHDPNVIRLDAWDMIFPTKADSSYKNYFEPKPNNIIKDQPGWLGHSVTYTINEYAQNERYTYPIDKNKNTYRIVTIGDSFTFGLFVNTKDNYPERLEDLLRQISCRGKGTIEVINLGVPAYDISYAVHNFLLRGKQFNPDLIIWLIKKDDFDEITEDIINKRTNLYSQHDPGTLGNMLKKIDFWDIATQMLIKEKSAEYFMNVQNKSFTTLREKYSNKILILTFPFLEQSYLNVIDDWVSRSPSTYVHKIVDIYQENGYFPDTHPNEHGYTLIAQDIKEYLLAHKLINCNVD